MDDHTGGYAALTDYSIVYLRSTKRPVRYIEAEVLSEEDGSDTELVRKDSNNEASKITASSPIKKPKVSNKEKKATPAEDNESTGVKENELQESSKPKTTKKEANTKNASKKKKWKKGETTKCQLKILLM